MPFEDADDSPGELVNDGAVAEGTAGSRAGLLPFSTRIASTDQRHGRAAVGQQSSKTVVGTRSTLRLRRAARFDLDQVWCRLAVRFFVS